jgi:hypothetical protein
MQDINLLIERRNRFSFAAFFSLLAAFGTGSILLGGHLDRILLFTGPLILICSAINVVICWRRAAAADTALLNLLQQKPIEDRLDELERLKRRELVTPEEYAAKRQEILQDL